MSLMLEALEQRQTEPAAAQAATLAAASTPLAGYGLNSPGTPHGVEGNAETAQAPLAKTPRPRWQVLGAVALAAVVVVSAGTALWRAQSKPPAANQPMSPAPGVVGDTTPLPGAVGDTATAATAGVAAAVTGKHITEVDITPGAATTARGDPRAPLPGKPAAPAQPEPPTPTQPGTLATAKPPATSPVGATGQPAPPKAVRPGAGPDKLQLQRVVPADSAVAAWNTMAAGRHEEALAQYRRVLARQPDDIESLVGAASLLHRAGDREAAYQTYRRALAVSPNHAGAMSGMLQLMGEADPATAESRLKDFIESNASDDSAHAALGQLLARQNRWSEAQSAFFQAHTQRPERASHAYNLAVALDRLHQSKQAIEFYRLATTLRSQGEVPVAAARARIERLTAALAAPAPVTAVVTAVAPAPAAPNATADAPKAAWWKRLTPTELKPSAEEALP